MAGIRNEHLLEALDGLPVASIVEYLFARLHLDEGVHWLRFRATDGSLRRTEFERGPIENPELEQLARPVP